jgi:hypothetical protein
MVWAWLKRVLGYPPIKTDSEDLMSVLRRSGPEADSTPAPPVRMFFECAYSGKPQYFYLDTSKHRIEDFSTPALVTTSDN